MRGTISSRNLACNSSNLAQKTADLIRSAAAFTAPSASLSSGRRPCPR
jgi:hypothetical protein